MNSETDLKILLEDIALSKVIFEKGGRTAEVVSLLYSFFEVNGKRQDFIRFSCQEAVNTWGK